MFWRTRDKYYIFIAKNTLKPRFFFACGELNLKYSLQYSLNNCNRFCFKVSSWKWGASSNDFVYFEWFQFLKDMRSSIKFPRLRLLAITYPNINCEIIFCPSPSLKKTCYPSVINVTVPNKKMPLSNYYWAPPIENWLRPPFHAR